MYRAVGLSLWVCVVGAAADAADWNRFRGPDGAGVSLDAKAPPITWSPTENLAWKTELPGAGVSSPITVNDRVFVTCYSGYGIDRENADNIESLKRHLVCLDRTSGELLWDKTVDAVLPEDPYSGMGVPAHGYASHTPVSDGERVFVFFGKSGALAFDMDGKQLWQASLGTGSDSRRWGSASSPIVYGDLLIVTASSESRSLVGLDKKTGKEVWRQEADGLGDVWGTPTLASIDGERTDLVIGVPYEIWGVNPETGKLRWYSEAMETDQFNSSVVVANGIAYAIEGRGGGSIAVRIGGKGNVTASNVLWTGRDSARFGTPVVFEGRVYYFANGVANCIDAKSGDRVFQGRLTGGGGAEGRAERSDPGTSDAGRGRDGGAREGGTREGAPQRGRSGPGGGRGFGNADYSSPVIAGGHVYFVQAGGDTFVLKAGTEFEQLAVNQVTEDRETFAATPAISDGRIFLRSNKHLYCVADPDGEK